MAVLPVRHVSVSIDAAPAEVYAFAREPSNLPRWAAGLGTAISELGGEWIADSPRLAAPDERRALGAEREDRPPSRIHRLPEHAGAFS